ncbi:MAG: Antitoxin HigA [uncultured Paraburkholderia sp.]|nr:MAG: Antitoxin HigA [uncultured Paraburkholderia sp.]CAH2930481.1 MAG: Antitoxin HigA [uncultured Paraburkholderia sp.]
MGDRHGHQTLRTGGIDFSDIDTGESIPEIHPGEILRGEFLEPLGMSVNALALALRVPAPRINDIVRGKRAISTDTALRLERYFGASAQIEREIKPMPKADRPKLPKVSAEHAHAAALASHVVGNAAAGRCGARLERGSRRDRVCRGALAALVGVRLRLASRGAASCGSACGQTRCGPSVPGCMQKHGADTNEGLRHVRPDRPVGRARDEVADPQNLSLWLEVDGHRYQNGSTNTMVFGIAKLVSYVSQCMGLQPGDVISTGTPPGVGIGVKPNAVYLN